MTWAEPNAWRVLHREMAEQAKEIRRLKRERARLRRALEPFAFPGFDLENKPRGSGGDHFIAHGKVRLVREVLAKISE